MTTRPTDIPKWADVGSIVEPADAKQDDGFIFEERPPFEWVNWFWNRVAIWAQHFASVASKFTGPDAALNVPVDAAPLAIGDTCIIGDWSVGIPGFFEGAIDPGSQLFNGAQAVGDLVGMARGGNVEFYARDGSGLVLTVTPAVITMTGFVSNGEHTVMWDSNAADPTHNVEIYRHSNGGQFSLNTGAGGALPQRCWVGPDNYYVAFAESGSGIDLERYNLAGGFNPDWSISHSGGAGANPGVSDVMQWGPFLFLIGSVSGHASGATMRCIESSTGRDLTGECGVGTSVLGDRLWNAIGNPIDPIGGGISTQMHRRIVCDGQIVVAADPTFDNVGVFSVGDGQLLYLILPVVDDVLGVELDRENIYVSVRNLGAPNKGFVYAFNRAERSYMWRYPHSGHGVQAPHMSADGFSLAVVTFTATNESVLVRNNAGPRLAQRVDVNAETFREGNGLPFQRRIV